MNIGKIESLACGPKRNVELRTDANEVFSGISKPPGPIRVSDIVGYEIAEERRGATYSYPDYIFQFFIRLQNGARVLFYTGSTRFDLALLLDEMTAVRRDIPRKQIPFESEDEK